MISQKNEGGHMSIKKVLVTGGAGFIGAQLCKRLLEKNYYVYCLDNLYSGKIENLDTIIKNPNLEFINQDICLPFDFEVDEIYNLACPASPLFYQKDPIFTLKTNVLGALNCLELAKNRQARILQTSTSEIYGDPENDVQTETYWGHVNPIGIRSCYDEGKRCAETLFFDYARTYNIDIRVARIFNTYGPYMRPDDGRVMSNFINQALAGNKITVYGDGLQTRSFCYVDDMLNGLIALMEYSEPLKSPINLGNPSPITMLTLAEVIAKLSGKSIVIEYLPLPSDDPRKRQPDITLAKKLLDWEPKTSLENGIKNTIKYYANKYFDCDSHVFSKNIKL